MERFEFIVEEKDAETRIDVFLYNKTGFTRSRVKTLIDGGECFADGKPAKPALRLKAGQTVALTVPDAKEVPVRPNADIPLEIVYEDDDIAVINKQRGLTVHAGNGTGDETLVNALLANLKSLSGINGELRPGIVHRIDKNTTGLLVVAKNDAAHVSLAKQIEKKECKRVYYALLEGVLKTDAGRVETKIGRDSRDRTKMAVTKAGVNAVTDYRVLKRFDQFTLCEFSLQTGRTHQIRVHAKYLGHPVVGDPEYGYKNQKFRLNGQLLHAGKLTLTHPKTGKSMTFTAKLPEDFLKILKILSKKG